MLKKFLTESKSVERASVIWNMVASLINAFQSVVLLMVMTHLVGLTAAGIYTIGNTYNNLFATIGRYGTRFFQVSDLKKEYSFREYRLARYFSCLLMVISSFIYVLVVAHQNGYSLEKLLIVLFMCLFKVPDAFEDVYYADYQKNRRLDIGAKAISLRLLLSIGVWMIALVVSRNLLLSTILSTIITFILMIVFIGVTKDYNTENNKPQVKKSLRLLLVTLPLCVAGFLGTYISAAPRSSIDKILGDDIQAIYGFISMPVFVVQLMLTLAFNPVLYKVSCIWDERKIKEYIGITIKYVVYVIIMSAVCIVGAWLLGIPVLSFLYKTDLTAYKTDLIIMMVAAGFVALTGLFGNLLTIMRYQNVSFVGTAIVALIAFVFSNKATEMNGMRGAVWFYMILLLTQSILYFMFYLYGIIMARKEMSREHRSSLLP